MYHKCISVKELETRNGYTITREEDKKYDEYSGEYKGHTKVFYCVSDIDLTLECFKTLREARKYADSL